MPQVDNCSPCTLGTLQVFFMPWDPFKAGIPNFLSKWMEAVFVSVGCAVSTTLKAANIVVGGYKMLWVVIYFGENMQYTLLGRDEGEGRFLSLLLGFCQVWILLFFPIRLFESKSTEVHYGRTGEIISKQLCHEAMGFFFMGT